MTKSSWFESKICMVKLHHALETFICVHWRNLPIVLNYLLSFFISWCFLVHLIVVQAISAVVSIFSLLLPFNFSRLMKQNRNAELYGITLWYCTNTLICNSNINHIVIEILYYSKAIYSIFITHSMWQVRWQPKLNPVQVQRFAMRRHSTHYGQKWSKVRKSSEKVNMLCYHKIIISMRTVLKQQQQNNNNTTTITENNSNNNMFRWSVFDFAVLELFCRHLVL